MTVTVITLALGLGTTTAVFGVLDAVVLNALPYRHSERLAVVWVDFGGKGQSLPAISAADFRDLRETNRSFEVVVAGTGRKANLTGKGDPEQVEQGRVTHDFFSAFGVEPALGRRFQAEEDVPNGPSVVLLSHGLWQRRFGGDREVLGRTLQLDGIDHRVVGVMPEDFELLLPAESVFLRDSALWTPCQQTYDGPRNRTLFTAFARLRDGVTIEQAQGELDAFASRLRATHLVHKRSDTRMRIVPLHGDVIKSARPALVALFAAAILILVIACGNVAALLIVRTTSRRRELAIRLALGAGRHRIVRQIVVESGLLAIAGGTFGVLLAALATRLLRTLGPADLPRAASITMNGSVFAFAAVTCGITVLLFGVLPAMHASRPRGWSALAGAGRQTSGRQRLRQAVVVGQVALALVVLFGAGLLSRSLVMLRDVHPGFESSDVLTFRLSLPASRYSSSERVDFYEQLEEQLRALPGVDAVGAVSHLPLAGGVSMGPYAYDEATALNWESVSADVRMVTPELFSTLGIRLTSGRPFDSSDAAKSVLVAIVDDTLATKAWPGEQAVGQRVQLPVFGPEGITREWHEVIGTVEHVHLHDLARKVREQVYLPHAQTYARSMDVVVRTKGGTVASSIQPAVRSIDGALPVHDLRALDVYLQAALAEQQFTLGLASVFGAIAVLLAAVGIFGVVRYAVERRRHEFGVRLALGATAQGILSLVLRQGLKLVLVGLVVGLPVALVSGRVISSLLFGVSPSDPVTFATMASVLVAAALIACYVPARYATRVDPVTSLRHD